MEKVHEPESRPWISDVHDPNEFLQEWLRTTEGFPVGFMPDERNREELYASITNDTPEDIKELELLFSENSLRCPYEDDIDVARCSFTLPDDIELDTVKSQVKDVEKRTKDNRYKGFVYCSMKFWNYPQSVPFAIKEELTVMRDKSNCIPLPDVMFTVQIYRPEQAIFRYQKSMLARTASFHVDQEFWVLGSQCLTELRDRISCVSDLAVRGDLSEDPNQKCPETMKDVYKSGLFYVNGVFYDDMRDPLNIRYSQKIMDWWSEDPQQRGVGPFSVKNMENTQFKNLVLQIGYPYLYMHQGNCEHIIVFSDMRVVTDSDSWCKADYPMISQYIPKKRLFCMVCHIHTSKWVVTQNQKLPEDQYFFCDECFKFFHYSKDMNKLMDFEARRFICRSILD